MRALVCLGPKREAFRQLREAVRDTLRLRLSISRRLCALWHWLTPEGLPAVHLSASSSNLQFARTCPLQNEARPSARLRCQRAWLRRRWLHPAIRSRSQKHQHGCRAAPLFHATPAPDRSRPRAIRLTVRQTYSQTHRIFRAPPDRLPLAFVEAGCRRVDATEPSAFRLLSE